MTTDARHLVDPDVAPRPYARLRQIVGSIYIGRRDGVGFLCLVAFSSAAAILEAIGLSLVALFAYSMMGEPEKALDVAGPLKSVYTLAVAQVGATPGALFGLIFMLVVGKTSIGTGAILLASWLRHDLDCRLYRRMMSAYLDCSPGHWQRYSSGDILNALDSQSYYVGEAILSIGRILTSAISAAIVSIVLILISWELLLVALVANLCLTRAQRVLSRRSQAHGMRLAVAGRDFSQIISQAVTNLRSIWAVNGQRRLKAAIETVSASFARHFFSADLMAALTNPVSEVGIFIIIGLMALTSTALGLHVPATLSVMLLLYRLQPQLRNIEECRIRIAQYGSALEAVWAVLDPADKEPLVDGQLECHGIGERVTFEHVSYSYPGAGHAALEDISFTVPAGCVSVLTGPSGSGKSTLIGLMMRMQLPQSGRILAGGVDIAQFRRDSWFRRCAFVGQDIEMFGRTLGESLTVLSGDLPSTTLQRALDICGLTEIVNGLPNGLDTTLGQRGAGLSVGQRQRVGIARALLANPDMLVLDEATSGLDHAGEDSLMARLRDAYPTMTILLISHRSSSIRWADRLFILEAGRLREGNVEREALAPVPQSPDASRTV